MPKWDVISFDLGSTLLDYAVPLKDAWARALCRLGYETTPEAVDAFMSTEEWPLKGMPPGVPETIEHHRASWTDYYASMLSTVCSVAPTEAALEALWNVPIYNSWKPFDDVGVLGQLRDAGFRLALVSNWSPTLTETLRHHGLDQLFEVVVCSAEIGWWKPQVEIFQYALDRLQVEPDAVVHVGDKYEFDVEPARAIGMDAVLLDRKGLLATDYEPRVRSLAELVELISR